MRCVKCGNDESRVLESRDTGASIRRRRECMQCKHRYTTYERIERPTLTVIKKDGRRVLFDRQKLNGAIRRSVGKFFDSEAETEDIVAIVEDRLYDLGEPEVKAQQIGDLVLSELASRNEIAYIRFASVYREFKSADEFVKALKELRSNKT